MLRLTGTSGAAPLGSGASIGASSGAGGSGGLSRLAVILMATIIPCAVVVSQSTLPPCPGLLWPTMELPCTVSALSCRLCSGNPAHKWIPGLWSSVCSSTERVQHIGQQCSCNGYPTAPYKCVCAVGVAQECEWLLARPLPSEGLEILLCRCWQLWWRQSLQGRMLSRKWMRQTYRPPTQAARVG